MLLINLTPGLVAIDTNGVRRVSNLTDIEHRFCRLYIETDFNGTEAVKLANFRVTNPKKKASDLLLRPEIMLQVARLQDQDARRDSINRQYVREELYKMSEMDFGEIIEDDGSLKPIKQWPAVWRKSLSAVDMERVVSGRVDGKWVYKTLIKKLKWPAREKLLELLGKHTDVRAFREIIEGPEGDAPPLNIHFNVAEPQKEIEITKGKDKEAD